MKRTLIVGAATAGLLLISGAIALAAEVPPSPACTAATTAADEAKGDLDGALGAAIERGRELGVTEVELRALVALLDGGLTGPEIEEAKTMYKESGVSGAAAEDLLLVLPIASAGQALYEAEQAKRSACPPAAEVPPADDDEQPALPADNDGGAPQIPVLPSVAPATGGGPAA